MMAWTVPSPSVSAKSEKASDVVAETVLSVPPLISTFPILNTFEPDSFVAVKPLLRFASVSSVQLCAEVSVLPEIVRVDGSDRHNHELGRFGTLEHGYAEPQRRSADAWRQKLYETCSL